MKLIRGNWSLSEFITKHPQTIPDDRLREEVLTYIEDSQDVMSRVRDSVLHDDWKQGEKYMLLQEHNAKRRTYEVLDVCRWANGEAYLIKLFDVEDKFVHTMSPSNIVEILGPL